MDTWEILLQNSTLTPPGFDAWEHLNNQGSGSGPCDGIVLIDGLRILLDNNGRIINIDGRDVLVNVDNNDTDMLLDQNDIYTNVDNNDVGLNVPNDNVDVVLKCGSTLIPKDELMQKVAGSNIGGFRCLVANDVGEILHADVVRVLAGKEIIGISTQAVAIGSLCDIAITGDEIIESSWNWDTNKSIYATEYGHLTQVVPIEDYLCMVAVPLSPTSIRVRIEPPIFL